MTRSAPNLWRDTPGSTFGDKYAVLLSRAENHTHGGGGKTFVDYNDAVRLAHDLNYDKNKAREERR